MSDVLRAVIQVLSIIRDERLQVRFGKCYITTAYNDRYKLS